MTKKSIT